MAKLGKPIEMPPFDVKIPYQEQLELEEQALIAAGVKARLAAKKPGSTIIGELLRWPRGDGHAVYMVIKDKPLTISHVQVGDAWGVEMALIRGLRIEDVRYMSERSLALDRLFQKKGKEK